MNSRTKMISTIFVVVVASSMFIATALAVQPYGNPFTEVWSAIDSLRSDIINLHVQRTSYAVASTSVGSDTNSHDWVDIPSMSVSITVTSPSVLIITSNIQCGVFLDNDISYIRALVNGVEAEPSFMVLTQTNIMPSSNIFIKFVNVGTYTVKTQWKMADDSVAFVMSAQKTLTVLALPQ